MKSIIIFFKDITEYIFVSLKYGKSYLCANSQKAITVTHINMKSIFSFILFKVLLLASIGCSTSTPFSMAFEIILVNGPYTNV